MNIIDVTSLDSCMCRTDDGKLLESESVYLLYAFYGIYYVILDLPQGSLETLIPKEKHATVMVVAGKHKHKVIIMS